jgi:hypothetical protein
MRWDVLNELLDGTTERRFLEIGVQHGQCGKAVRAAEKWGVDPEPLGGAERGYARFHRGSSDSFFARLGAEQFFDVVFVDGLHEAEQVYRDVENALAHLAPGGFVVMHDCNPLTEIAQRVPRASRLWNGDCWKAMVRLRQRADLDAFTINTDHGIGVVRKAPNPAPLEGVPADLGYAHLAADRERLLGLVPADRWVERLGGRFALGRVVVLTAIFGQRDNPIPAPSHDVDEYLMFTDGAGAPGWRVLPMPTGDVPRASARRVKTLALDLVEDADVVVWIDGRIHPSAIPLRPLLRRALRTTDIAGFPHPWRSCAYAEARACAELGVAPASALEAQADSYRDEGLPEGRGLWNTMVLARRRTPAMVELGRAWWDEIQRHTLRDQVSFPYLVWKHGLEVGRLGKDVYRAGANPHFGRGQHRRGTL